MPRRLAPITQPVRLLHDGNEVIAERGEPLAAALLGAGRLSLARSPKLHRPRGPYCLRGACDGCLVRVDGEPNVTACLRAVRGGEQVETQNVLGSRELDLLRAADFLFPHGVDHHRLFAGVRGVSPLLQKVARRVAGLGQLPEGPARPGTFARVRARALIAGGGAAGLSAARVLGPRALLADDALTLGGSVRALDPGRAGELVQAARAAGASLLEATAVVGLYREPHGAEGPVSALLVGPQGTRLVVADAVVVATGEHAAAPVFANNDLPGVISARAALLLFRMGVAIGERLLLVGQGRFAAELRRAYEPHIAEALPAGGIERAIGRSQVTGARVHAGDRSRRVPADAIVVEGPGAPAFELAVQAGATVRFDGSGYRPQTEPNGRAAPRVWCAGSVILAGGDSIASGEHVARQVLAALERG